jgi:hypothetical protein
LLRPTSARVCPGRTPLRRRLHVQSRPLFPACLRYQHASRSIRCCAVGPDLGSIRPPSVRAKQRAARHRDRVFFDEAPMFRETPVTGGWPLFGILPYRWPRVRKIHPERQHSVSTGDRLRPIRTGICAGGDRGDHRSLDRCCLATPGWQWRPRPCVKFRSWATIIPRRHVGRKGFPWRRRRLHRGHPALSPSALPSPFCRRAAPARPRQGTSVCVPGAA